MFPCLSYLCIRPLIAIGHEVKNQFYRELARLIRSMHLTDIVIVAGDNNAQLDKLTETERYITDLSSVPADGTNSEDRSDHIVFLVNTNFGYRK